MTQRLNAAQQSPELFKKLSQGGEVLMPLNKYPFSERYGWTNDKFGVSWQVTQVSARAP